MKMLQKLGEPSRVDAYVTERLAAHQKISGFGHRVYRTEDPRATHLREMSRELGEHIGNLRWYEISRKLEEVVMQQKHLYANVDFYSASCYFTMGIPIDMFTPVFAVSRIAGWAAHVLEQYGDNRLIRPRAEYVGEKTLPTFRSSAGSRPPAKAKTARTNSVILLAPAAETRQQEVVSNSSYC